jgi:hypothetical protein
VTPAAVVGLSLPHQGGICAPERHPLRDHRLAADRTHRARWPSRGRAVADSGHWCQKGHILFCLAGELETELADGRLFRLKPGTSYQVADNAEPHRSRTASGATLFIID